jgi:HD-GYP domain-containing protein (c-di-GMP phosphodiesterase class II)
MAVDSLTAGSAPACTRYGATARYRRGVTDEASSGAERIRTAELVAAICLASDLAMGFPFEHGFRSTLIAMRLVERLDAGPEAASHTYYVCLLSYAGCTAEADVAAEIFHGKMTRHFAPVMFGSQRQIMAGLIRAIPTPGRAAPVRAAEIVVRLPRAMRTGKPHLAALCEVAEMLTERLGLPTSIQALFPYLTERWDGKSGLARAKRDEIPLPVRITHVARDAAFQQLLHGEERAASLIRERAGHAFDPAIAAVLADDAAEILTFDGESLWEQTLAAEPFPALVLQDDPIERALAAMGDFADLVSPFFVGHSAGVADLVADAALRCGLSPAEITTVRRAGLVHDVGRVAVPATVWQKPGPLTADEWEQVRLHPYQTERVLDHSPALSTVTRVAGGHHERLDGSGYHRGATAVTLSLPARLLAAADAYHAMTQPRPHRAAFLPAQAAELLVEQGRSGLFDAEAATAVLYAAGQHTPRIERPAGLTEREAEVVGLLARGLQTKQIASALGISAKTADHHVQSAYGKIGVSTRAAATLFAMEHGLTVWGELPIARKPRAT